MTVFKTQPVIGHFLKAVQCRVVGDDPSVYVVVDGSCVVGDCPRVASYLPQGHVGVEFVPGSHLLLRCRANAVIPNLGAKPADLKINKAKISSLKKLD